MMLKNTFLCFVLAVIMGVSAHAKAPSKTIIGKPLPASIVLTELNGTPAKPITATGHYVLMYWASWCANCAKHMPVLQDMLPQLKQAGITPILINADRRPQNIAQKTLTKWGITKMKTYVGDMYVAFREFNVQGMPIVVSVAQGRVVDIMDLNTHKWNVNGTTDYFKQVMGLRK